jgi:cytochrome c biogenesis protein CcmG, thiol:disulfide interchange protein DsbE
MKRLIYILPLAVFAVLVIYFAVGLTLDPRRMDSVLIDQEIPPFDLVAIQGQERGFASKDILGQVTLVNIFGSWCIACRVEHPFLMDLKKRDVIPIYGIDWREKDRDAGPAWLAKFGNPYTLIGDDPESRAAIAFGVTGAPESFLVDKRGVIRYKHVGPINPDSWRETLAPIVEKLRKDPS